MPSTDLEKMEAHKAVHPYLYIDSRDELGYKLAFIRDIETDL